MKNLVRFCQCWRAHDAHAVKSDGKWWVECSLGAARPPVLFRSALGARLFAWMCREMCKLNVG